MNALVLLADTLAAYRLTRLVVVDQLTAEPRDYLVRAAYEAAGRRSEMEHQHPELVTSQVPSVWADVAVPNDADPPKLAILTTCPWCAGMWVALGVVAARNIAPRLWGPLAKALAISACSGLVAAHLDD